MGRAGPKDQQWWNTPLKIVREYNELRWDETDTEALQGPSEAVKKHRKRETLLKLDGINYVPIEAPAKKFPRPLGFISYDPAWENQDPLAASRINFNPSYHDMELAAIFKKKGVGGVGGAEVYSLMSLLEDATGFKDKPISRPEANKLLDAKFKDKKMLSDKDWESLREQLYDHWVQRREDDEGRPLSKKYWADFQPEGRRPPNERKQVPPKSKKNVAKQPLVSIVSTRSGNSHRGAMSFGITRTRSAILAESEQSASPEPWSGSASPSPSLRILIHQNSQSKFLKS